ncbi:hypothetical protein H6G93_35205 [Nostoc sp. FACHB-973]|nr:hypothetical protein [Nostoc sp. FACHB-973]
MCILYILIVKLFARLPAEVMLRGQKQVGDRSSKMISIFHFHREHTTISARMRSPGFVKFTVLSNKMRGAIGNTSDSQNLFLSCAAK